MSVDQQAVDRYRRRIEAAAIAGLILQPAALDHVRDWLEPTDFATPHYGDWYTHLLNMREREDPIDQMTLLTALRRGDQLGPRGQHADELATIAMQAPVPTSTVEYCRTVLEESIRDEIAAVGVRIHQMARDTAVDVDRVLFEGQELVEQQILAAATRRGASNGAQSVFTRRISI